MSEENMRSTVRRHVKDLGPEAHWQRFEDSLASGIPDINICYRGVEYWLEAKFFEVTKLPKRLDTPVRIGLQPEQCEWLVERGIAKGRAGVLLKLERSWYLFTEGFEQLKQGLPLHELKSLAKVTLTGKFDINEIFLNMG